MANDLSASGGFYCKTIPGSGYDFGTGGVSAFDNSTNTQVFDYIRLSAPTSQSSNLTNITFGCNSTTIFSGSSGTISTGVQNNGEFLLTSSDFSLLLPPNYVGDVLITCMWGGSEQGTCVSGGTAQTSNGGTNSFDLWRFNIEWKADDASTVNFGTLIKLKTVGANAPVITTGIGVTLSN